MKVTRAEKLLLLETVRDHVTKVRADERLEAAILDDPSLHGSDRLDHALRHEILRREQPVWEMLLRKLLAEPAKG